MAGDRRLPAAVPRRGPRVLSSPAGPLDLVVVGAGIVGLATARSFLLAHPGAGVVVVDKEPRIAAHQSGRNSGVIHAGVYYPPGSEKAQLCREGRLRMIEYCAQHDIPHELCGKVVVATDDEEAGRLEVLADRARSNGVVVHDLRRADLAEREPHAVGVAAIHVPETGVVDFGRVCEVLAEEIRSLGGELRLGSPVRALRPAVDGVVVELDGETWACRAAVNCGGLHSDELAGASGRSGPDRIVPFRGEYFDLRPERSFLVRGLIYPVPDPRFPFLGVHFTRGIDGHVHAGPNAVLALGREAYAWSVLDAREIGSMATDRRLWKLAQRYWRTGFDEMARSLSRRRLVTALQRLVPEVQAEDLSPAPAGIRAQLVQPDGKLVDDFAFAFDPPIVHVLNAPSPAATASLAIGERIALELEARRAPAVN